jgi:chorismate dehydratase
LIWSFTAGSLRDSVTHIDGVPARCAELLSTDEADFGLVPIIEYQRIADAKLVAHVCVGSRQKVKSVLLVSRLNNLKKIRSVALDKSSRTSATLTKIIFKEFLGIEPTWVTSGPDISRMLQQSDAALMIGDPAMTFSRTGLNVWDLASLWHDFTGSGFVFAMWMAKGNVKREFLSLDFAAARDEGVNSIDKIVEDYQQRLGVPREELRAYLTNNLTFDLDNDLKTGMHRYFELAARHGLIDRPRTPEYLQMHDSR